MNHVSDPSATWAESTTVTRSASPTRSPSTMRCSQCRQLTGPTIPRLPIVSSPEHFSSQPSRRLAWSAIRIRPPRSWRRTWSWNTVPSPTSTRWLPPGCTSRTRSRPIRTSRPSSMTTEPPAPSPAKLTSRRGRPATRRFGPTLSRSRIPLRRRRARRISAHQARRRRRKGTITRPGYASAAGHRGKDLHLAPVGHRRLEPLEVADVLASDVDVDEAPQPTVAVGDPLAQLAVLGVDGLEHLADGRTLGAERRLAADRRAQLCRQLHGDRHQTATATSDSNAS